MTKSKKKLEEDPMAQINNLVAKHMNKFVKCATHTDKKHASKNGYVKHKKGNNADE